MSRDIDRLWNRLMRDWRGHWCVAGFFFVAALLSLVLFATWESRGGVESRGVVSLLYNLFGKRVLLFLFGGAGTVFLLTGIVKLVRDNTREPRDEDETDEPPGRLGGRRRRPRLD